MTRLALTPATIFGFGTLLAASTTWYFVAQPAAVAAPAATSTSTALAPQPTSLVSLMSISVPSPTPPDYRVMLLRAGLSPEALAAAGVEPGQVAATVQAAVAAVSQAPDALGIADAAYAEARANTDRLKRKIQSGKAEEGDVQAYQAAKAALASATTAREAVLNQVFDAATASLGDTRREALQAIRTNRAAWNLPTEFLVVNRSEEEWVQLRDFLANERIAPKVGEEPDPSAQAALANWRANASVAAARTGLTSNLDSMRSTWNQATGD